MVRKIYIITYITSEYDDTSEIIWKAFKSKTKATRFIETVNNWYTANGIHSDKPLTKTREEVEKLTKEYPEHFPVDKYGKRILDYYTGCNVYLTEIDYIES